MTCLRDGFEIKPPMSWLSIPPHLHWFLLYCSFFRSLGAAGILPEVAPKLLCGQLGAFVIEHSGVGAVKSTHTCKARRPSEPLRLHVGFESHLETHHIHRREWVRTALSLFSSPDSSSLMRLAKSLHDVLGMRPPGLSCEHQN